MIRYYRITKNGNVIYSKLECEYPFSAKEGEVELRNKYGNSAIIEPVSAKEMKIMEQTLTPTTNQ